MYDISKFIFLHVLYFDSNKPALVHMIALYQTSDKSLSESKMVQFIDAYIGPLGCDELY